MIYSLPLNKMRNAMMIAVMPLLAVSCGSYQQASYYDNDGIYSDGTTRTVERQPQQGNRYEKQAETDTYSDYFGQKANEYNEILDGDIFTDVDSYSSQNEDDNINQGQLTDYYDNSNDYQGFGGWGDNTTSVSINYYNTGWNNPWLWNGIGGNWYNGGFYSGVLLAPWYNGWNRWGGYYGWGWNNWGWGGGFGWGGYGYGWCPPYGYYGRNYGYGSRSYAYNSTRRGYYNRNIIGDSRIATSLRGRSNVNTRGNNPRYRSTAARSSSARSSSSTARSTRDYQGTTRRTVGVDQNRAYRTSRSTRAVPRYNGSSMNNIISRSGTNRSGISSGARTTTPRTSAYRSSGNNYNSAGRSSGSYRSSGSNNGNYRSSGNSTRSSNSGSYQSSGSSSRSSGNYRSSGSSGSTRSSGSSGRSSSSSRSSGRRQ